VPKKPWFWEWDDRKKVVDYSHGDFREYWHGPSKALLHSAECRILDKMLPDTNGWFLDLGCGFGRLTPEYRSPHRRIVLCDYAMNHLHVADDSFGGPGVHVVAVDANNLPFRDGVFDGGICIRLLHHIPDIDGFLKELARVFRPGCGPLVSYMNRRNALRTLRYGASCFHKTHEELWPQLFGTHPDVFARSAQKAGFEIVAMRGTGLVHQLTHEGRVLDPVMEKSPILTGLVSLVGRASDVLLGPMRLALMQYALVRRRDEHALAEDGCGEAESLVDILRCPACREGSLTNSAETLQCLTCAQTFEREGRVYDLKSSSPRATQREP